MMRNAIVVCLALFMSANALSVVNVASNSVTPMQKVITLIQGLKGEVEAEGVKEAATYSKFACFCKKETASQSKAVREGTEKIGLLSADHGVQSASEASENADNAKRKQKGEAFAASLASDTATCSAAKATYEASAADSNKAISSLKSATKSMNAAKPSLIQVDMDQVRAALELDSVRAMVVKKTGVDPKSAGFAYHSNDIIALCTSLLTSFKAKKAELDADWQKRSASCTSLKAATSKQIADNTREIAKNDREIQVIKQALAKDKKGLIEEQTKLGDAELLLKDLTASCETRAKDWDQRTKARAGEVTALTSALTALTGTASAADSVNKRAALVVVKAHQDNSGEDDSDKDVAAEFDSADVNESDDDGSEKESSLLQTIIGRGLTPERRALRSLATLQVTGRKIGSLALSSLAVRAEGSPFEKVKGLVQKLMERLLAESEAEVSKKGYCDEKLATLKITQEDQFEEVNSVSTKIGGLQTTEDELTASISKLTRELKSNADALKEVTKTRQDQKAENTQSIATAKTGLSATKDAMNILRTYYSDAAKAAALLQASPLDTMTGSDAGFKGSYNGGQSSMGAVTGLLETIQSDFDRTIRTTEESEAAAQRDFVTLSSGLKVDSAGSRTSKQLDNQDLQSTKTELKQEYDTLESEMGLLDNALKNQENLKPMCIDTGMSYKERVAKRNQEISALEQALKDLK